MQGSATPLVAIIGAGASLASGDYHLAEAPPLTTQLFGHPRGADLIHRYPLAQMAGRLLERRLREGDFTFEEVLRDLRQSPNAQRRHMSIAVPLYLQDLLLEVSRDLHHRADRYDALIDALSDLPQVHYVTLNYDLLLDLRLNAFWQLKEESDYIDTRKPWSLIKLHGSVNWGYPTEPFDPNAPPSDLWVDRRDLVIHRPTSLDLGHLRRHHGGATLYPALALPEGPKDELVAPRRHLDYLRHSIASAHEIDVLVLGYSALDNEVLELIRGTGTRIRRLTVVNRDAASALSVYETIAKWRLPVVWPDVVPTSLQDWVDEGGMTSWAREYGGPYRTISEPDAVRRSLSFSG